MDVSFSYQNERNDFIEGDASYSSTSTRVAERGGTGRHEE